MYVTLRLSLTILLSTYILIFITRMPAVVVLLISSNFVQFLSILYVYFFLSLALCLSLTPSSFLTLTYSLRTHSPSLSLSLSHSLSLVVCVSHTLSIFFSLSFSRCVCLTHSLYPFLTLFLSLCVSHRKCLTKLMRGIVATVSNTKEQKRYATYLATVTNR